ncbi:MAG: LuxR C-terminal-related transcriptional regulator [Acidimicrobiales bacterium]
MSDASEHSGTPTAYPSTDGAEDVSGEANGVAASATAVLLIGPERLFLEALSLVLAEARQLAVLGPVDTAEEALAARLRRSPDVAVLDEPGGAAAIADAVATLRRRLPEVRVLALLDETASAAVIAEALPAGVSGFVCKTAGAGKLVDAILRVAAGETYIPQEHLAGVLAALQQTPIAQTELTRRFARLTLREAEVLTLMIAGANRSVIAEKLFISTNTVRTHMANIFAKLEVHSHLEAVSLAINSGHAPPPCP